MIIEIVIDNEEITRAEVDAAVLPRKDDLIEMAGLCYRVTRVGHRQSQGPAHKLLPVVLVTPAMVGSAPDWLVPK